MIEMNRWEVWDADVPYEDDNSESKVRPVVVISPSIVLVLKMTTHQGSDDPKPLEYEMMKWSEIGLPKKTFVQCDRYVALSEDKFIKKIGRLLTADVLGIESMMRFHGLDIRKK